MTITFKKATLAAALLASTALVAPTAAWANAAGSAVNTAVGTSISLLAPIVGGNFTAAYGQNVRVALTRDGVLANQDSQRLYALLYNNGTYVGYVPSTAASTTAAQLEDQIVALPGSAAGYNQVVFVFLTEDAAVVVGDTYDGGLATVSVTKVVPTNVRTVAAGAASGVSTVTVPAYTATAAATAAQVNAIGAVAGMATGATSVVSTYNGPVLTAVNTSAILSGTDVKLTFNANLAAIAAANTAAGTSGQLTVTTTAATLGTALQAAALVDAGALGTIAGTGQTFVRVTDAGGAFTGKTIASASIAYKAAYAAGLIADEALNPAAATATAVAAVVFQAPAYAASGTTAIEGGFNANTSGVTLANLWTAAGATAADATASVDVSLRLSESIGSNVNAADDFALSSGLTFGSVQTATGTAPKVRLTLAPGKWRFNPTTGALEYLATGTDWTAAVGQTVALATGASAPTTSENIALVGSLAAKAIYAGEAPAVGALTTADPSKTGLITGLTLDFGTSLTALPSTSGFALKTTSGTTPDLTTTVTLGSHTAADSIVNSKVSVIVTTPATANWDGTATAAQTTYTTANYGTGLTGTAKLQGRYAAGTTPVTYATVFDVATGSPLAISTVGTAAPTVDGSSPVIIATNGASFNPAQGTTPASGSLVLKFSETLVLGTLDLNAVAIGGSPVTLLALNAGTGTPAASLSTTTVANDTLTITNVPATVVGGAVTIGSTLGYADAASNAAATDGTKVVVTGTTSYVTPLIAQAIGIRASSDPASNITSVLVKFDKPVTLATGGVKEDGMFKVYANVSGTAYAVSISAANVDLTSAATTGYITLTVPTPGIKGTVSDLVVNYSAGTSAAANKLVSAGSDATTVTDSVATGAASAVVAGVVQLAGTAYGKVATVANPDVASVQLPSNTTKLYTQEVTGALTTNGTTAIAQGSVIRADLVDITNTTTITSGNLLVPGATANAYLAISNSGTVAADITNNRKLGLATTSAYVKVTLAAAGTTAASIDLTNVAPVISSTISSYAVSINNTTGAVSGSGVAGAVILTTTPTLAVTDTVYQVTNDGTFRLAVGANTAPTANAFVLASVKQPTDTVFKNFTSPVPAFRNYVPFASNVVASGTIGAALGTVNLSLISTTSVDGTVNWQLVGLPGALSFGTTTRTVALDRLLITVQGSDGAPISMWRNNGGNSDQAFTLVNNAVRSALQIGSTSIDNSAITAGGYAAALQNPNGSYTTVAGVLTGITAAVPFAINYPVTSTTSTPTYAYGGTWSLVTSDVAVPNITTWAVANKVGAVIVVGSGSQQKSWFSGSSTNTTNALAAGDRAFVYFTTANAAYAFGR